MILDYNKFIYLPFELVDNIADYHNYIKYCKPNHEKIFIHVLNDILDVKKIFCHDSNLSPSIVYQCWGNGWPHEWELDSNDGFYNTDEY